MDATEKSALPAEAHAGSNSDAVLLARVRQRDGQALASLYDRYSGLVYAIALRVLGETSAAEDILQEIFLQLWRKPEAFDPSRGAMASWLSVLARNRAIDQQRKRRPESDIDEVPLPCDLDLEGEAIQRSVAAKARACLADMPAEQRRDVELAFFSGLTHSEIAAKTGEPLGTVKTRIRTALIALRRALA
jgi:RNA polymerase sigma-70 factor (ECF subfamily)